MRLCISRASLLMRRERKRLKRRLLIYWRCVKTASETPLNNLHSSSAFDQLKVTGRYWTRWPITALRLVIFAHIQHGVKLAWGISTEKDRSEVIKRTTIKILGHHLLHPGNGPYVKVAEEGLRGKKKDQHLWVWICNVLWEFTQGKSIYI